MELTKCPLCERGLITYDNYMDMNVCSVCAGQQTGPAAFEQPGLPKKVERAQPAGQRVLQLLRDKSTRVSEDGPMPRLSERERRRQRLGIGWPFEVDD